MIEKFIEWLESRGCTVEVYQPNDNGSGYACMNVLTPDDQWFDITVQN